MQDDNENKTTTEEKDPYAELFTMESYQRIWAMRRKANNALSIGEWNYANNLHRHYKISK